jgi:uncharacterized membrane protein
LFQIILLEIHSTKFFEMKTEKPLSIRALGISTRIWFVVAFIGQMIFAYYIISLYGKSGVHGNFEKWNKATPHGYQVNDLLGNFIFGLHVALAAIITIGGPLQIIPQIRSKIPTFHRISGRVYIILAFIISFAGLYLSWIRGSVGGLIGSIFISINAIIIMVCAANAIRFAMKRQFDVHQKWAIRLYLGMSGVWFFRVFLMLWLVIHQAPVGFDPETFQGPFLNFLYVLVYIMPQVFVEMYFQAKESENKNFKFGMSAFLFIVTLGMVVGIFAATMGMWLPRL